MKKSKRMTIEELRELNPSLDNPIKLVCDDGEFLDNMIEITVIGVKDDHVNYITMSGFTHNCGVHLLEHYPSFKEEDKFVEFFEHVNEVGNIKFLDKEFKSELRGIYSGYSLLPNGRSYKLNLTTGERV